MRVRIPYPAGDRYERATFEGEWSGDYQKGVMKYVKGGHYKGELVNGRRHGEGTHTYKLNIHNGVMSTKIAYTVPCRVKGVFQNGCLTYGRLSYPDFMHKRLGVPGWLPDHWVELRGEFTLPNGPVPVTHLGFTGFGTVTYGYGYSREGHWKNGREIQAPTSHAGPERGRAHSSKRRPQASEARSGKFGTYDSSKEGPTAKERSRKRAQAAEERHRARKRRTYLNSEGHAQSSKGNASGPKGRKQGCAGKRKYRTYFNSKADRGHPQHGPQAPNASNGCERTSKGHEQATGDRKHAPKPEEKPELTERERERVQEY